MTGDERPSGEFDEHRVDWQPEVEPYEVQDEDLESRSVRKRSKPSSDEKMMGLFCHLGGLLGGFLVPMIIWLIKKDESRFIDDQGKEALNFQLTLLIGYVLGGVTLCFFVGIFLILATWIFAIVAGSMGAIAANKGEYYRYPLNIRFIQ